MSTGETIKMRSALMGARSFTSGREERGELTPSEKGTRRKKKKQFQRRAASKGRRNDEGFRPVGEEMNRELFERVERKKRHFWPGEKGKISFGVEKKARQ